MSYDVGAWVINVISSILTTINSKVSTISSQVSTVDSKVTTGLGGVQIFTSNGTFVVPSNVKRIWITACAGGKGGNIYNSNTNYGGEGGDWIFKQPFSVSPSQSISIAVGKGGAGKTSSDENPGGNTVIGSLITLLGGGVTGNISGGSGGVYNPNNSSGRIYGTTGFSGNGGNDNFGDGGGSLGRGGNMKGHVGYGGGGSASGYGAAYKGGDGIVIIEW